MTLEDRVARLEQQNRWLRWTAGCAGLCLLLVLIMGANPVRTNNLFQVNDDGGRVRIEMQAHRDFGPMISLYDNESKERVRIGSDQNATGKPFLWFFDKRGERTRTIE